MNLVEGASLKGRLTRAGIPAVNAEVRLDWFGRESGSDAWSYRVLTDQQGRFSFAHLPPNRNCILHGVIGSLGAIGAVPTKTVQVHDNGSTNDLGDLKLNPTFTIDGQIRLTDGKPIPGDSFLNFGSADKATSFFIESPPTAITTDGAFHLADVPGNSVTIYLRVWGYELTPMDRRLIAGSSTNIVVSGNLTNLVIEMHPESNQ